MTEVIKLYKKVGETPLECINQFREKESKYRDIKMTYLGRLDPMAEGLLLVLAGDTRDKEKYLNLDKTYEFEVLWGFETDTYDILGLVEGGDTTVCSRPRGEVATGSVPALLGKRIQKYPPFSSKSFKGDYLSVREGDADTAEREIEIFELQNLGKYSITGREILEEITAKVSTVKGDFRQSEILEKWREILFPAQDSEFLISKFKADVSSGTYIRSLAHDMGGIAYSIKRTRVGEYSL